MEVDFDKRQDAFTTIIRALTLNSIDNNAKNSDNSQISSPRAIVDVMEVEDGDNDNV